MANYKIVEIEGIGKAHANKLEKVGVSTVSDLLEKGATRKGRKELAEATGIDEALILKWVNAADLFRIPGIGSEYAELLEKAGVDSVKELRDRKPENLYAALVEANEKHKLVRKLPGPSQVEGWVQAAKQLEPVIKY
jgi:predicted flap endonuclease-1-like 5' DNA nuclease